MSLRRFVTCILTLSIVIAENKTRSYEKAGVVENGGSSDPPKFEAQHYEGVISYPSSIKFRRSS